MTMSLWTLVQSLEGHDIEKMMPDRAEQFKAEAMSKFREATAQLPGLVLPHVDSFERFIWDVEAEDSLEWIGRFSLQSIDQMEANLGNTERVRMAAALFPDAQLTVDLMGEFHYAGGLNVFPSLEIAVRVGGGDALVALEHTPKGKCDELVALAQNCDFELTVRACEDATDDLVAPADLSAALRQVARAVRSVSKDEPAGLTEPVELKITLPVASKPSEQSVLSALRLMGTIFTFCASPFRAP